jgi:hypothetical protein
MWKINEKGALLKIFASIFIIITYLSEEVGLKLSENKYHKVEPDIDNYNTNI